MACGGRPMTEDRFSVAASVEKNSTFAKFLGLRVEELGDGRCRTVLELRPEHLNHGGVVHGGLYGVVADHTAGVAASTVLPPDMRVVTSEYKINLLRPGDCEALRAEGSVIKSGRRLIVGEAKIWGEKGGRKDLLAAALLTFAVISKPKP